MRRAIVAGLVLLSVWSPAATAQFGSSTQVEWRVSRRAWIHADPCRNPDGVPSRVTYVGSDGNTVQEERRSFCSSIAAEAALDARLDRWGPGFQLVSDTSGSGVREIWALLPDTTDDVVIEKPEDVPQFVHYIRLTGHDYFDLFGSDERHIRLAMDEMARRFPNDWAGLVARGR